MNIVYLDAARERIAHVPLLVNVISRRVKQLNHGQRPMVKVDGPHMSTMDLALKEIAEGTLTAEMAFRAEEDAGTPNTESVITL